MTTSNPHIVHTVDGLTIYGLDDDWDQTDEGHNLIYTADPADIPASCAPRVIYELRRDCDRLNSEYMDLRAKVQALAGEALR